MAAFEKINSGIPEMDQALDHIRLGDNVVFRVSSLDEFRLFVDPIVGQAKKDHRKLIYFRFASHEPLVEDCPEVKKYEIPLSHRFETNKISNTTQLFLDVYSDKQNVYVRPSKVWNRDSKTMFLPLQRNRPSRK